MHSLWLVRSVDRTGGFVLWLDWLLVQGLFGMLVVSGVAARLVCGLVRLILLRHGSVSWQQ